MSELQGQLGSHAGGDAHQLLEDDLTLKHTSIPAPTAAELSVTYVAPGRLAQLPTAISYHAHWKNESDGMAKHARQQVRALALTGLPLRLQSMGQRIILNEELPPSVQRVLYLEGVSSTHTAISIKQLVLDRPVLLREAICPVGIRNSLSPEAVERIAESTIIYTSWERDRVHPDYIRELSAVGQIWVPCATNRAAFVRSGVPSYRIKVVPCPYDPEEHTIAAPRGKESVPRGKMFYNIGKWEPRKNQHGLLGAFLTAFTPKSNASLFIKTSGFGIGWGNYPSYEESIDFWLGTPEVEANGWTAENLNRLVRVVDKKVSESDLNKIHQLNNIYVSAAFGEAWDMPAFDAKMAGNRLVYVGYGGPQEYAEPSDIQIPWEGMVPVHPYYEWEPDAQWADVRMTDIAEALQQATPPGERLVPTTYVRRYSLQAVGQQMEDHIQELATRLGCWGQIMKAGGFG